MRMLSDVPWGELIEGDFVIYRRGTIGKIEALTPRIYHVNADFIEYDTLLNLCLRCSQ